MTRQQRSTDHAKFLRASRDINYVKEHGRRYAARGFNLLVCRTAGEHTRVGIVVGKRFGTAVSRNRAKRLFRELTRQAHDRLNGGFSLLVFPKREAMTLSFPELRASWCSMLRREGIMETNAH